MPIAQSLVTEARRGDVLSLKEGLDVGKKRAHAPLYKCDRSHRQGVIFHDFTLPIVLCEVSHMASGTEMEELRAALQRAMDARGIKAKPLAIAAGLGETAVRDILKGKTNTVQVGTLRKIAEVLNWPVYELLGEEMVPLEGKIGAGGQILFAEDPEKRTVARPPGASGPMIALEVRGESMMPAYRDGDIVYIRRDHNGVLPEYLGEECAVHTIEGGTFLKVLAPGSKPGRYTLRSFNAADMENVEVVWASPVLFVMRRPLKRMPEFTVPANE